MKKKVKQQPMTSGLAVPRETRESTLSPRPPNPTRFSAYAVSSEGARCAIEAERIVIDIGTGELEVSLTVSLPVLAGQLPVRVVGEGLLLVGHADASSICIGIEQFGKGRLESK